jgi:phospholipid-binding lipoprotein MlaA
MRSLIPVLLAVVLCAGCATTGSTANDGVNDPFERANRAVFSFNRAADRYVLRPVATGYHNITPDPLERSISKFFVNWSSPIVIVSDLLQGKFKQAGSDTARFLVNSTLGVLGFFDPATHMGLEYHEEDFGQAFGRWGIDTGPYVMVPFFGPFTLRDGIGRIFEIPIEGINQIDHDRTETSVALFYYVDKRTRLLAGDDALDNAFDPYIFLRDAYLQRREYLLYDGDPPFPEDDFGDDYSEEDFLSGE